ncbi:MAG: copper resistance protein B [Sphingobium sp.]
MTGRGRKPLLPLVIALLMLASPVSAQDHMGHAGHIGHAGHMGHAMPMPMSDGDQPSAPSTPVSVSDRPAPRPPGDHAADAYYDPAEMARARASLRLESGGMPNRMVLVDRLEWRPGPGRDGYAWEAEGWAGGDIDRFAFRTQGEGASGSGVEQAEVQALWSHALDPWFNVQAGLRQDLDENARRTYAVIGVEGIAPYWFAVDGQIFLSNEGEVTARAEASYDQRITQRLIAQPAMELNLSAQNVPERSLGAGLSSVELGMRLRYEVVREVAPYIGVHWERRLGRTANYARVAGEDADAFRLVAGIRFWF